MARRPIYRSRISPRKQRDLPVPRARRWQWLAAMLGLGALAFIYWFTIDDSSDRPSVASPVPSPSIAKSEPVEPKSPATTQPASPTVEPAPEEPRFTFYTLLPEKEVTIPEGEVRARKRAESLGRVRQEDYFIQVGSFHSPEDAGRIQAVLSQLGVQARLEETEIGKVMWYRVRIGPFTSMREVESIRARLRKHRIDSIVQTSKR